MREWKAEQVEEQVEVGMERERLMKKWRGKYRDGGRWRRRGKDGEID